MDRFYAKFLYHGEAASVCFGPNLTYVDLCDKIRTRFPAIQNDAFRMKFTVHPDATVYHLQCEAEMVIMFITLDIQNSVFVDIDVQDVLGESSAPAQPGNQNTSHHNGLHEPNEYLGCYRREDARMYMSNGWKQYISFKGQQFEGGVNDFRKKLRMYAIELGFEYKYATNKAHRVIAKCSKEESEGCEWHVKASLARHNGFFVIYSLVNDHKCRSVVRSQNNKMLTSDIVKEVMLDKVRDNPNSKAIDIQQDMKLNYGLEVPYHKAWYGKELARGAVLGVEADSYRYLKWFVVKSTEANPGSCIHVECSPLSDEAPQKFRFKRMFVSYKASINGFQFCRPVLHVDATFITNKYRGTLLSASAKDANCGLYPVAYAIVDSENEDNWMYFFKLLKHCLKMIPRRTVTFISDRNLGLLKSVKAVFPKSPLGFCYRHLQTNLMNKYPSASYIGKKISNLFMNCAYSRTQEYFDINMKILRHEGGVVVDSFLKDFPCETWASYAFNGERFGEMTNNLAECFNSWIKDWKGLPILDLNERIRLKIMSLIATRKHEADKCTSQLCPNLEKKLDDNIELGRHWVIIRSDTFLYEVRTQNGAVTVNLESRTCVCGEWKVQGFPCAHAVVAVQKHGSDIYSYVNQTFKVSNYRSTYSFTITPVPTISKQVDMSYMAVDIQPPLTKRAAGRPRKNRYKSKNDRKRLFKCGRCQKFAGHNQKTCKEVI